MEIGSKKYESILITDLSNNLIATINDENIIAENGVKVELIEKVND
ncbi:MAG: hypothetical protein ACRCUS_01270 [Anaerovoracaceae bacterium]